MKIILLKEVQGLGHAGDIKEVSDGYGRNFLLPGKLAEISTQHSLAVLELRKRKRERIALRAEKDKVKLAKKINGQRFAIKAKADQTGTLYAKIDAKAIASVLAKQGFKIEENEIKLPETIKKIGEYEVDFELGGESGKIKLEVRSEK